MPIVLDNELYKVAKAKADELYKKPSAYKAMGGRYKNDDKEKDLKRWFQEDWKDIGNENYPVYRPTRRINKKTPLTINEIDKQNLKEQINEKQIIKGKKNLPPFQKASKL